MTNHTRSSNLSLAALLLAGLSAACTSEPLAGTSLPPPDDGASNDAVSTGGVTVMPVDAAQPGAGGAGGGTTSTGGVTVMPLDAAQPGAGGAGGGTTSTGGMTVMPLDAAQTASGPVQLDILFMVDNSPSMDPKQARLAANFPLMINVLQQIPDGKGGASLPDVHIGVISSDMGAGSEAIGQNCKRVLGDRGLLYGNDPNNPLASVAPSADPTQEGHPQANGCGLHSGQRWISDIADPNGNGRTKNYDGNIQDVFSCLATAVGTSGCGFEHQLQSLRVALSADYPDRPTDPANNINPENIGFVRPNAYLGIVLVTDEDDCSADPDDTINDGMFLETQQIPTETASLRCAARGHVCNGQPIPGYSDPSIGYQPPNPLPLPNVGFSTAFSNCAAKDQIDPSHPDQHYLPLIRVQDMIDSVNGTTVWAVDAIGNYVYQTSPNGPSHVSVRKAPDKILVAGIFGWPVSGDPTGINYQIGIDTTSLPVPQNTYWDYMPICMVRTIVTVPGGNIYKAYGGLRLKKFVDAYGDNGAVYSICDEDFSPAMQGFGAKLYNKLAAATSH